MIDKRKLSEAIGKIVSDGILRTESVDTTKGKLMKQIMPLVNAVEHLSKTQQKTAHDAYLEGFGAAVKTLTEAWNLMKK